MFGMAEVLSAYGFKDINADPYLWHEIDRGNDINWYAQATKKGTNFSIQGDIDKEIKKDQDTNGRLPENIIVKNINFNSDKEGTEQIFIEFNQPSILKTFAIKGDRPRIVIDAKNVYAWEGPSRIPVNGKLIKQIRIHLYHKSKKLRVVIDLFKPVKNFQTYYKEKNIYCIEIKDNSLNASRQDVEKKIKKGKNTKNSGVKTVIIKSINFKTDKDGSEKVFIEFNQSTTPEIFALEGDRPRIVIDIKNVYPWKGRSKITLNGKLIMQIRTYFNQKTKKLRIVLDLYEVSKDYSVDQVYYKKNNLYCVKVRKDT